MKIGKISIELQTHPTLGDIFVIKANGANDYVFDIKGDDLVLRVTKDTAILLSQFIDETLESEYENYSDANN